MDEIASTPFGRKFRAPRMDLWYYFVHRALELLRPAGSLSFIVNAYWTAGTGAEKLIGTMIDESHVEEIFFFSKLKVFERVSGQHMVIRLRKGRNKADTTIKYVDPRGETTAEPFVLGVGWGRRKEEGRGEGQRPQCAGSLGGHWGSFGEAGV